MKTYFEPYIVILRSFLYKTICFFFYRKGSVYTWIDENQNSIYINSIHRHIKKFQEIKKNALVILWGYNLIVYPINVISLHIAIALDTFFIDL